MVGSPDRARHLRWLMAVRAVVAATLLLSALAINLILSPDESLAPFYFLAAAVFVLVLTYAVLYERWHAHVWFSAFQIAGDTAVVTGFVYASGGVHSPMSFLYLLPVIASGALLPRAGAFVSAVAAWLCYVALVVGTIEGFIPDYPAGSSTDVTTTSQFLWYSLLSHILGFLFAAMLSTYLAERLRSAGMELAERHSDIARLRALNENIVESITSGLITTDLEGRITFVNPAGAEILRVDPQEIYGTSVVDLLGLDREFLQRIRGILGGERRYRFEKSCRLREGEERFLGLAASVLKDRPGRPLGLILAFQDLTEIIALEQEIRLKERMAALGEMAAGMAHELRNPLASISGSVQVLHGELSPTGEQAELMEIIIRESQRLDQAIRDFLLFARPGPFAAERHDLVRLINDSVRLLRNSREFNQSHHIETRFSAPEIHCEIDVNRAKQVFWNLATNALKAMPTGGRLTISVDGAGDDRVRITFADEGIGMDEQQAERYFQPFQGGFADGTGLGAAIVYRIVQEHGGSVTVRSARGRGTSVIVTLPVRSAVDTRPALAQTHPGGGR